MEFDRVRNDNEFGTDAALNESKDRPDITLGGMLGFEAGLGVLAVVLAWAFGVSILAAFGGDWVQGLIWGVLATGPMLVMLVGLERSQAAWVVELRAFVEQRLVPLFEGIGPVGIFLVALSAGVFEELLFRAVIQQGLSDWLGVWPALILASVLFGLVHAMTLSYFILATFMGLYLGGLYVWTDQLLAPMLTHFLYDWAALAWLVFKVPKQVEN
jgi:membrane protease YdiL (CAAX protease family)